jgi:hypothetical protein
VDEHRVDSAFSFVQEGRYDEAAAMIRLVDELDENEWLELHGVPAQHWAAVEYLPAIERLRAGNTEDTFFSSDHFRFHVRGEPLSSEERDRVTRIYETALDRIVEWAGAQDDWTRAEHRLVFVEIAESFPTPSPARTLIFFWDHQDRTPRMELTRRALDPRFLTAVVAHELTHAVLPHTSRPFAEGMANLVARETFPDHPNPIRSRGPTGAPWSLEEVLRFNVRAEGEKAKRQIELLQAGGFSPEATQLTMRMYSHGDDLVGMILDRWGRETLLDVYRETNRDPNTSDIVQQFEEMLGTPEELRRLWSERTEG